MNNINDDISDDINDDIDDETTIPMTILTSNDEIDDDDKRR